MIIQLSAEREGCMGLYYKLGFVKESNIQKGDEIIETKGLKILLDGSSFLYLMGTTIDYTDDDFNAKFVFLNPNASVFSILYIYIYIFRRYVAAVKALVYKTRHYYSPIFI